MLPWNVTPANEPSAASAGLDSAPAPVLEGGLPFELQAARAKAAAARTRPQRATRNTEAELGRFVMGCGSCEMSVGCPRAGTVNRKWISDNAELPKRAQTDRPVAGGTGQRQTRAPGLSPPSRLTCPR